MRSPSDSTAVWPGWETWRSMPLRSSQAWRSASEALASSTTRHLVAERGDLVGDRVGEQQAEAGDASTARGRRSRPRRRAGSRRRSSVTNGLSSSAISPATMNSSRTGPAARATAHGRAEQRQHDELDPARHHDRATGPAARAPAARAAGASSARAGRPPGASAAVSGSEARSPVCAPEAGALARVRGARAAILFVGDIVASAGRRALQGLLPGLREEHALDFVVVNGENAAGGIGITPKHADELFAAGVDVITLGNHTYRHREVWPYLDEQRASCGRRTSWRPSPAAARACSSATTAPRSAS